MTSCDGKRNAVRFIHVRSTKNTLALMPPRQQPPREAKRPKRKQRTEEAEQQPRAQRSRQQRNDGDISGILDLVLALFNDSSLQVRDLVASKISTLRPLENSEMLATDFTIEDAVFAFGLEYDGLESRKKWRIQDMPEIGGY